MPDIYITIPRKKIFKNIYQFKITLLYTDPTVWRRVQVPESYTFYDLHVAIQDAMGWQDCHLHNFELSTSDGKPLLIESCFMEPEFGEEFIVDTEVPINKYLSLENNTAIYTYDFGDGWRHKIVLEKIQPKETGQKYPVCLDGKLSCPPEDCGSIPG